MYPLLTDVTCPAQFLAAIVARDDAEDQDEDEPVPSFRGEPVFNVVGTLSGPTKEKVGNFLLEYYPVSVAPASLVRRYAAAVLYRQVGYSSLCIAGFPKAIILNCNGKWIQFYKKNKSPIKLWTTAGGGNLYL